MTNALDRNGEDPRCSLPGAMGLHKNLCTAQFTLSHDLVT